jgi:site-specific recombinase XerD
MIMYKENIKQSLVHWTHERIFMERVITSQHLLDYKKYLIEEEKSSETINKYIRDLKKLIDFADGRDIDKQLMIAYKSKLMYEDKYKVSSINSFLVAANRFCQYMGWYDARIKTCKVQRESFCPDKRFLGKEEYFRLVNTAIEENNKRLAMILQTICATGMRVSELRYVTVASVKKGSVEINCKGKVRTILLPDKLKRSLLYYIYKENIGKGYVFRTSNGNPLDRSNIWREMKDLCKKANVDSDKVFPHNLRHLFAQCFYALNKDIAKLADILGHSSIETTRIYIRTTQHEHMKMLNKMELLI